MDHRAAILLYVELVFALGILWREGLLAGRKARVVAIAATAAAFLLRYLFLSYETLDYQEWIKVWIQSLQATGAWKGLGQEIWSCNYNVPYLYFLAIFSKLSLYNLYSVKLLSILFDVLLAWFTMRLVGVFTQSPARRLTAFLGVLWLPTVILNGSVWGQCDSIYGAFAVLSLYLALSDRPGWSVAAIAVSLSFKLQAIFLMPVFLLFVFAKKMKVWHLFVFPAAYIVTILPAVFAGRNFWELLTLYYNNTGSIGDGLNYNSSSMYALFNFENISGPYAARIGIILALGFCVLVYLWMLLHYGHISNKALLGAAVLFCIGIPFLLPHMHDRYFFMADTLTFALAVISPEFFALPVLTSFASLLGYYAYLKLRFLMPMKYGSVALLVSLLLTVSYTALSQFEKREKSS
jgi:Predicted integral membrane protein